MKAMRLVALSALVISISGTLMSCEKENITPNNTENLDQTSSQFEIQKNGNIDPPPSEKEKGG